MAIDTQTNNLISRTLSSTNTVKNIEKSDTNPQNNIANPPMTNNADSIVLSSKNNTANQSSSYINFLNAFTSGLIIAGIFFLPDIVNAIKNRRLSRNYDKYNNFKPLIGDMITSQRQEQISKNRIKITLETIKGKFKENEILIMDKQGLIKQRILIRKEEMPNGKFIVRKVKSFQGFNLSDNLELKNNPYKYFFKEYYRSPVRDHNSNVFIKTKGKETQHLHYYSTSNGEITLISEENKKSRKNILFLFDKNKCIGTDKQIVNKETKEQYNILNIPSYNIFHKKYDFKKDGKQYDEKLMQKFIDNF